MNYFKIAIRSLPSVLFAHTYTTDKYHFSFQPRSNFMEISVVEQGAVIVDMGSDGIYHVPEDSVLVLTRSHPIKIYRKDPGTHSHSTVGIKMDFTSETVDDSKACDFCKSLFMQSAGEDFTCILPLFMKLDDKNRNIAMLIKKIIMDFSTSELYRTLYCSSLCLELVTELSRQCSYNILLGKNARFSPGSVYYSRKIMDYITANYHKTITLTEIAGLLGKTPNYLNSIFKDITGKTIIEYVNQVKINKVKELLQNGRTTLRQAGEAVGITDEGYLSRLFKKSVGLNAREYKMLKHRQMNSSSTNKI